MKTPKRGRGQPPKGEGGALVSQYPPLTVRIPPRTKHELEALSAMLQTPMWVLVDRAVAQMIDHLEPKKRDLLRMFSANRSSG